MKWFKNGVKFEHGNYYPIIAKFDNSTVWFELAESYESEHGTLFNLYEVDSVSYDEVRTVY